MATGPVSPESGRDEDPAGRAGGLGEVPEGWRELPPSRKDWLTEEQWVAWVTSEEDEEWFDPGEDPVDPEDDPGFGVPARPGPKARAGRAATGSVRAAKGSRRGPGQPGSARRVPGGSPGPAGAFAVGHPLDTAPGGAALHRLAEYAAGTVTGSAGPLMMSSRGSLRCVAG